MGQGAGRKNGLLRSTVELKLVRLALSGGKPSVNVLSGGAASANQLSGRMLSDSAISDAASSVN